MSKYNSKLDDFKFDEFDPEEYEEILNEEIEEKNYNFETFRWRKLKFYQEFANDIPFLNSCTLVSFNEKNELCLFGGVNLLTKKSTNELWIFKIDQNKWEKVKFNEKRDLLLKKKKFGTFSTNKIMNLKPSLRCVLPCNRCGHCSVLISNTEMLVFGGNDIKNQRLLNDMWVFQNENVKKWKLIVPEGKIPQSRWYASCVKYQDKVFFFGGETYNFQLLNDICLFSLSESKWIEVRTIFPTPSKRMLHTATVLNGKMYIIGGLGKKNNIETCDVWIFDLNLLKFTKVEIKSEESPFNTSINGKKTPKPLYGHSAYPWGNKIIIFGGKQNNSLCNSTWIFDTKSCKWNEYKFSENTPIPSRRWKHICTYSVSIKERDISKDNLTNEQKKILGNVSFVGKKNFILPLFRSKRIIERNFNFYIYGGNLQNAKANVVDLWEISVKIQQKINE